jgi:hypothetical protein
MRALYLSVSAVLLLGCPTDDDGGQFGVSDDDYAPDDDSTGPDDDGGGDDDVTPCITVEGTVSLDASLPALPDGARGRVICFREGGLDDQGFPNGSGEPGFTLELEGSGSGPWTVSGCAAGSDVDVDAMLLIDANRDDVSCNAGDYHGSTSFFVPAAGVTGLQFVANRLLTSDCPH